ncbi:hypothetical protein HDU93_003438, partial [Gonapodya sp. JEL0774]
IAIAYNKLDYAGIIVLTVASFGPALHYGFYCQPTTAHIYIALQAVLGLFSLFVILSPRFVTPTFRAFRAGVFVVFGLAGVVPVLHFSLANGWEYALRGGSVGYLLAMAICYIGGAWLYSIRWPESWWPGRFD